MTARGDIARAARCCSRPGMTVAIVRMWGTQSAARTDLQPLARETKSSQTSKRTEITRHAMPSSKDTTRRILLNQVGRLEHQKLWIEAVLTSATPPRKRATTYFALSCMVLFRRHGHLG